MAQELVAFDAEASPALHPGAGSEPDGARAQRGGPTNDARIQAAQALFWQIETLRRLGAPRRAIVTKLHRMARIHEDLAKDRLSHQDAGGWIELFAAITAWGEAGSGAAARALLRFGATASESFPGRESLLTELGHLEIWLVGLDVMPALEDFARILPRLMDKR